MPSNPTLRVGSDSTIPRRRLFAWQQGYGAFSVSKSNELEVIAYIRDQDLHHKRRDFKQEFLDLLEKHNVPYDPRFIWE